MEVYNLRPIFVKYNTVLREAGAAAVATRKSSATSGAGKEVTGASGVDQEKVGTAGPKPFVTTIHLIGSGLVKLGRLQPAMTLYRGITRNLPKE